MLPWPSKFLLTIATFAALIAAPYYVPQLHGWQVFDWTTVPLLLEFEPKGGPPLVENQAELTSLVMANASSASWRVQDPTRSLDPFYAALEQTDSKKGGVVRILHYGDSPTTADLITADVRFLLQERFGDAGHGLHLWSKPWAWYGHRGVEVESEGWATFPATLRQMKDGWYGVAGATVVGGPGAYSRLTARRSGNTRLRISYMAEPGGGIAKVFAEDEEIGTLDTTAPAAQSAWKVFPVRAGARRYAISVISGQVRLFYASLEKGGPGVIYDSIGLNGSWAGVLAYYMNEQHWARQMRDLNPKLVIINYGTNESSFAEYIEKTYAKDMRVVIQRIRRALPGTPILLMTPMDRGQRQTGGEIGTAPGLPRVVATQGKLAAEEGLAFFNTFEAMGGPGTMGRWYLAEPRLVSTDFIHPMPNGAKIVGGLLYRALLDGYTQYRLKQAREVTAKLQRGPAK